MVERAVAQPDRRPGQSSPLPPRRVVFDETR